MIWVTNTTPLVDFAQLRSQAVAGATTLGDRLAFLEQLKSYFLSNGLYDPSTSMAHYLGGWSEAMKSLTTCANRVVEFYVGKLEPGMIPEAMPIITDYPVIVEPIQQIWAWSSFATNKPVVLREYALYGDMFIQSRVSADRKRVYHKYYAPMYVTDFTEDIRKNITYIRVDIPNGKTTYTEIWDGDGYRIWNDQPYGQGADEQFMGDPDQADTLASLGIDFIPFAHAKFRDIGQDWGVGCFVHAMDKIDESNRMATRLHQMLFRYNKPLWAMMANAVDSTGKPLPPPQLPAGSSGKAEIGDDDWLSLPGMSKAEALVPNIQYGAALDILKNQAEEIQRDLPELTYANLKGMTNISGVAIRELMADAIDKVVEARGNFEAALVKADKHALTMGKELGMFPDIGSYDAGQFDHAFKRREVMPISEDERANTLATLIKATVPLKLAMQIVGYEPEIIESITA